MTADMYHAGPTHRRPSFRFSAHARVWFSDTDAQGVVYYGRYLPYFDHARLGRSSVTAECAAYRVEDDRSPSLRSLPS